MHPYFTRFGCHLSLFSKNINRGFRLLVPVQAQSLNDLERKNQLEAQLRAENEQLRKAVEAGISDEAIRNQNLSAVAVVKFRSENELPAAEKKLLAADATVTQNFITVLNQPNTGIFKLLSLRETKLAVNDVRAQTAYPQIQGGGTYYSFAKKNHVADEWSQIRLSEDVLQIGYVEMKRSTTAPSGGMNQTFTYTSGYSLGLLTNIGDVALEKIDREHPALKFLATLQPPTDFSGFATRTKEYFRGLKNGDSAFRAVALARVNTTYLLRSILYKKSDTLIAFRILKQDSDGSLHILWQQLQSFPTPELKGKPPKP